MHLFSFQRAQQFVCFSQPRRKSVKLFLSLVILYFNGILSSLGGRFQGQLLSFEEQLSAQSNVGLPSEAIQERNPWTWPGRSYFSKRALHFEFSFHNALGAKHRAMAEFQAQPQKSQDCLVNGVWLTVLCPAPTGTLSLGAVCKQNKAGMVEHSCLNWGREGTRRKEGV